MYNLLLLFVKSLQLLHEKSNRQLWSFIQRRSIGSIDSAWHSHSRVDTALTENTVTYYFLWVLLTPLNNKISKEHCKLINTIDTFQIIRWSSTHLRKYFSCTATRTYQSSHTKEETHRRIDEESKYGKCTALSLVQLPSEILTKFRFFLFCSIQEIIIAKPAGRFGHQFLFTKSQVNFCRLSADKCTGNNEIRFIASGMFCTVVEWSVSVIHSGIATVSTIKG